jgi:hypothetical protein
MHDECPTGNIRYPTPQDAASAAQRIRARLDGFGAETYHCCHCGGWHVTGRTKLRKARAKRKKPRAGAYSRHDRTWLREVEA